MNRRRLLRVAAAAGGACLAGCAGAGPSDPATPSDSPHGDPATPSENADGTPDCGGDSPTNGGPGAPYDSLGLYRVPDYVTEYDDTVLVEYDSVGADGQRAVQQALDTDGEYRECIGGGETDVMAFFSTVEDRWAETGESFEQTYLQYEGAYYGISLVQEGDFIRVNSVPCTADACPTTPTPPS